MARREAALPARPLTLPGQDAAGTGASRTVRIPLSRRRIDSIISRSVAAFGVVFGAQTVPVVLGQLDTVPGLWGAISIIAVFGSLLIAFISSLARVLVRSSHALVAIVFVLVLVSYMFTTGTPVDGDDNHWMYFLLTVATGTAAIAFSTRSAGIYLFAVPILYGVFRVLPAGGSREWVVASLDVIYSILLGAALMVIVTMLRQASSAVDTAQATALREYETAVRQHAIEVERVEVDAIVHDSVLTTLLSAASARTPEAEQLAATMARQAIRHLADAAAVTPDNAGPVPATETARAIADAADAMAEPVEVSIDLNDDRELPAAVSEAIRSAAIQAMVNSFQHAGGGVHRWVRIAELGDHGLFVEIGDHGVGFDIDEVPAARLGVRVSILERLASVGGEADVDSALGRGTVVRLHWLEERSRVHGAGFDDELSDELEEVDE